MQMNICIWNEKNLECKIKESKCNIIIRQCKNINNDYITKENTKEHNPNWPQIFDCAHKMFIIGMPGSWNTNTLHNLIKIK